MEADSSPVAPLLQQVAAEVRHFMKSFGYRRMPTRSELCNVGEKRAISKELITIAETLALGSKWPLPTLMGMR